MMTADADGGGECVGDDGDDDDGGCNGDGDCAADWWLW